MSSVKFTLTKHTFPGQHIRHYAGGTRHRDEDVQYLEATQYKPLNHLEYREGDITIIGTCAIRSVFRVWAPSVAILEYLKLSAYMLTADNRWRSFPKEVYEPLWDDLFDHCESHGIGVRSIWTVDKSDHGASGILNEHTQSDDPSFSDLARDLLNMINIFRDEMTVPIVGVGHSMGGTALLELSNMHPRLFASLILIDPVIGPAIKSAGLILINASARRPDLWSSREEAEQAFKSTRAFQRWDPRVQRLWLEYGLRDTPTLLHPQSGMVTLRTTKAIEAWSYGRPWFDPLPDNGKLHTSQSRIKYPEGDSSIFDTHPFYRPEPGLAWDILPRILPGVLYIFPAQGSVSSSDSMTKKVIRTGRGVGGSGGEKTGRVDKAVIQDSGHLVPFEKPTECARAIGGWFARDLQAWEERMTLSREKSDDKSVSNVALSDEYVRRAKEWFETNKKTAKSKL